MLKQKDDGDRGGEARRNVNSRDIFRNAFYPLTLPLTVGPGRDLCGHHAGCECAKALGAKSYRHLRGSSGFRAHRAEHFPLLRLRGWFGDAAWGNGDERGYAPFVVLARLHRRADFMEWRQCFAAFSDGMGSLT
jgi:hypothetical protein